MAVPPPGEIRLSGLEGLQTRRPVGHQPVDQSVLHGRLGSEDPVPVGVPAQRLERLPCVVGEDPLGLGSEPDDLIRLEDQVGYGALATGRRLVQQHPGVREDAPPSGGAPAASRIAAVEQAWPMQVVAMGGRQYSIPP